MARRLFIFGYGVVLLLFVPSLLASCTFDVSGLPLKEALPTCGNGKIEEGEECDGTNVPSCEELDLGGGVTFCTSDCRVDTSGCSECVQCSPGERKCHGDTMVVSCTPSQDDTSCLTWQEVYDCALDGKVCWKGYCVESCTDECTDSDSRCSDEEPNTILECHKNGACMAWDATTCDTGFLCDDASGTPVCAACDDTCEPGALSCSSDSRSVLSCQTDAYGCTSFVPVHECDEGLFCSTFDGTCVPCSNCTEGDVKCSEDGEAVVRCDKISDQCTLWNLEERCETGALERCSEGECVQYGDECASAPVLEVGSTLHVTDLPDRFHDVIDRRSICPFPSEALGGDDLPQDYGPELVFGVRLGRNEAVEIVARNPLAVIWAMGRDCSNPVCDGLELGSLIFGAPEEGTYYFAVELPAGTQTVDLSIHQAQTSCTAFAPLDGSVGSLPPEGGTYCVKINQGSAPSCFTIKGERYLTIRTVGFKEGARFACGGDTVITVYDQNGRKVDGNDDIGNDRISLCSRVIVQNGDPTKNYTVCVGTYDSITPISPYVGVEVRRFQDKYFINPGNIIITEVDQNGEIELRNTTENLFSLQGCTLGDGSRQAHLPAILVPPDDYVHLKVDGLNMTSMANLTLTCGQPIDTIPLGALTFRESRSMQLDVFAMDATGNDDPGNWCPSELVNYRYTDDLSSYTSPSYHSFGRHNHPCDLQNHEVLSIDFLHSCPGQDEWLPEEENAGTWSCGAEDGMKMETSRETWARYRNVEGFDFRDFNYVYVVWHGTLYIDSVDDSDRIVAGFNVYRPYREGPLTTDLVYGRMFHITNRESEWWSPKPISWEDVEIGYDISRKASHRAGVHLLFAVSDDKGSIVWDPNMVFTITRLSVYAY